MSELQPNIINCSNCVSGCCRARTGMQITSAEAEYLEAGGTNLKEYISPQEAENLRNSVASHDTKIQERQIDAWNLPIGKGLYITLNDCGWLTVNELNGSTSCSVHDDPLRPLACREFPAGSEPCKSIRSVYGLDTRPQPKVDVNHRWR